MQGTSMRSPSLVYRSWKSHNLILNPYGRNKKKKISRLTMTITTEIPAPTKVGTPIYSYFFFFGSKNINQVR